MRNPNNITGKYILDEQGNPVEEPDVLKWGEWFESSNAKRFVAESKYNNLRISTVFMALDHAVFQTDPPLLYETMLFGGKYDGETERYSTKREALLGHQKMVMEFFPWYSIQRLIWTFKRI